MLQHATWPMMTETRTRKVVKQRMVGVGLIDLDSHRAKRRWGRRKGVRCIAYNIWFFRFPTTRAPASPEGVQPTRRENRAGPLRNPLENWNWREGWVLAVGLACVPPGGGK